MTAQSTDSLFNPYPGLRPFQSDEDYLFFGREEQTAELLRRLSRNRFVAVVGTSGSGKSSLVRCGLLSELQGGGLVAAGSHWEIAVMHPGGDPIRHLAHALLASELYDPDDPEGVDRVLATLKRSDAGLVEAARQSDLEEGCNLLLVVDQFEEIFRFHQAGSTGAEEAPDFVRLLLEASRNVTLPIYVVLTMRSDFLGDCSRFAGLAEAVNNGEYLIPRLNREQTRSAIEGPAKVAGGIISWRLMVKLLNDLEEQADRLPVLQHGLMRLWDAWARDHRDEEPLDLRHYNAIGGLNEALSIHADEIYDSLPDDSVRRIAARVFKALTEKGSDNRGIRRPCPLGRLQSITGGDLDKVTLVVNAYRRPGVTFLMPGEETALEPETVIDISHESLMRVWKRLQGWVEDESQSARIYRRLCETAELHAAGQAGLYHDPDLQIARVWRDETQPNHAWARHYGGAFERTMAFLEQSEDEARRVEREAEAARQRELEQAKALAHSRARTASLLKRFAFTVAGAFLVAIGLAAWALKKSEEAREAETMARKAEAVAEKAANEARHAQGRTWLANARALVDDKDPFAASLKAARALGFEGFGRNRFSPEVAEKMPVLLEPGGPDWEAAQQFANDSSATLLWQSGALPQHSGEVNDLAVSPDGQLVVSAAENEDLLRVWDAHSGVLTDELACDFGNPEALAFSPDGGYMACGTGGSLAFWRIEGRRFTPMEETFSLVGADLRSLAFSPDGELLVMGDGGGDLYAWPKWYRFEDLPSEPVRAGLHEGRLVDLEFSPSDSRLLVSAGRDDRKIHLLSTATFAALATFEPVEIHPGDSRPPTLYSVAFSPDGKRLAAAGNRMPVTVWNLETRRSDSVLLENEWNQLSRNASGAYRTNDVAFLGESVAFSKDGKRLAVAWGRNGQAQVGGFFFPTISLFDLGEEGSGVPRRVRDIIPESRLIHDIRWCDDDQRLVLATVAGEVRLVDAEISASDSSDIVGHSIRIRAAAFSPDGLHFATGDASGIIGIWEARTGKQVHRLSAHEDRIRELRFGLDGRHLFSVADRDFTFKAWDVATGEELLSESFPFRLQTLDVSPDGKQVVLGGWSNQFPVYDAETLRHQRTLLGAHGANRLRFFPDGRKVAALHYVGGEVSMSVLAVGEEDRLQSLARLEPPIHEGNVCNVSIRPDGQVMATAADDGTVKFWERGEGDSWHESRRFSIPKHERAIEWIEFDAVGRYLATATGDEIAFWDAQTGALLTTLAPPDETTAFASSPDGSLLLSGGERGMLQLWSIAGTHRLRRVVSGIGETSGHWFIQGARSVVLKRSEGLVFAPGTQPETNRIQAWELRGGDLTRAFELKGHSRRPGILALSEDESLLASAPAASGGELILWDLETKSIKMIIDRTVGAVLTLAFSPDRRTLACTYNLAPFNVFLFDVSTGQLVGQTGEHGDQIFGLHFSEDGRRLISGADRMIRIWTVDPETRGTTLERGIPVADSDRLTRFAVSPDGKRLASASTRGRVYLRDLETLEPIGEPLEHEAWVLSMAFSPDGRFLASGGGRYEIRVSRVDPSLQLVSIVSPPSENVGQYVSALAFGNDGDTLIASSNDGTVKLWELPLLEKLGQPADYLEVVDLAEASGALEWKVASRSMVLPREPRVFFPIADRYLRFLDSSPDGTEWWMKLFSHYLEKGQFQSARAAMRSMQEEMDPGQWSAVGQAILGEMNRRTGNGATTVDLSLLEMSKSVFERHPPDLETHVEFLALTHAWPDLLALLREALPPLEAAERARVLDQLMRKLETQTTDLFARMQTLDASDPAVPPRKLLLTLALNRFAEAFRQAFDSHSPPPEFGDLPVVQLLERLARPTDGVMVARGSEWKFLPDIGAPPPDWREPEFDDSGWETGVAPLGFGAVSGGLSLGTSMAALATSTSGQLAFYFRKSVEVSADSGSLALSVLRDDGLVVYVDGREIFRDNLPSGTIDPETEALEPISGSSESEWLTVNLDPLDVEPGAHSLAVEVHQSGPDSSDILFDLALEAAGPPALTEEALAVALQFLNELDPAHDSLSWLDAFEDDLFAEETEEAAFLVALRGQWSKAFGGIEEFIQLADRRIAALGDDYSPRSVAEAKQWLAWKEAILTESGRTEEAEAVRRALFAAPPRDPKLDSKMIDLTDFYNASLYDARGWVGSIGSDLRNLPEAFAPRHGVSFDLRGAISLNSGELPVSREGLTTVTLNSLHGKDFPDKVEGIPVNRSARAIHFLASCHWGREAAGVEVAKFTMRYEDGTSEEMPVFFGVDVLDWWDGSNPNRRRLPEEKVGYRGRTGGDTANITLSELIWKNPHPDKVISSIDFVSTLRAAGPFLLGITLEE